MENVIKMQEWFTDATEFLKKLIQIESISGNEVNISKFLQEFLKFHGFTILPSKVGNAVGIKGSGNPILLFSSHMDTVPTNNPFRLENGKIFVKNSENLFLKEKI
jgi:acetylornithine deacetylase/succinyl-diaminopimelate desuccinylase-like protein